MIAIRWSFNKIVDKAISQDLKMLKSIILLLTMILPCNSYGGIEKLISSVMPKGTMSNSSRSALIKEH